MSAEYGIFNDEGCIEAGFYDFEKADQALAEEYQDEPWAEVCEICPDHEEQPRDACEDCFADEDEDEED